ncbi:unnamed protein product [Rhizoctonia solani]|uniref:RING-type domain-containing protein n=1 Tax=Rhizoctonia solani TaxID=456999 RepID=A0A8H2XTG5_9AGAM|nr:unnamed protein product [Rhizoctonia solani]
MSARPTTRGNVTYLDHDPHEIPAEAHNRRRTRRQDMPSVTRYSRFSGKAPPLSLDRTADYVDDYYSHFCCPVCYLWRPNGESRAVRGCGHVVCGSCWDSWAHTHGQGPRGNRLTPCPVCRFEVNHEDTREVDFRASRFNSSSVVTKRLADRIEQLKQENKDLRATLNELRTNVTILEDQRQALLRFQTEMAEIARDIEGMAIDE